MPVFRSNVAELVDRKIGSRFRAAVNCLRHVVTPCKLMILARKSIRTQTAAMMSSRTVSSIITE